MVNPIPFCPPTPLPPPATDWSGNLRDVIDTQQQTIKFLLGQYNALLMQVGIGQGSFGALTTFAVGAMVPMGWWQTTTPATAGTTIGTVTIGATGTPPVGGTVVNILSGLFWSDGNVTITITGGIVATQIGVMPASP